MEKEGGWVTVDFPRIARQAKFNLQKHTAIAGIIKELLASIIAVFQDETWPGTFDLFDGMDF